MKNKYYIISLLFLIFSNISLADQTADTFVTYNLTVDGASRNYILYVPPGYTGGDIPVVFDVHGYGGSAVNQKTASKLWALSSGNQDGVFAIAYPDGTPNSSGNMKGFNGSHESDAIADPGCCGKAAEDDIDDVKFFLDIKSDVLNHISVSQFFYTGLSNGSYMGHRFLCENPGAFDGYGITSAALSASWKDNCAFTGGHKPVLYLHGKWDIIQPIGQHQTAGEQVESVNNAMAIYRDRNNCASTKTYTWNTKWSGSSCYEYDSCATGQKVAHCKLSNGHVTYNFDVGGDHNPAKLWWTFFQGL